MGPTDNFLRAMADAGLQPPTEIVADGRIHRFSPSGRRGDDAGWYVLYDDAVPAGAFGNWRDGLSQCWCARDERQMSAAERKALANRIDSMRRQRDAELRRGQAEAAAIAVMRWSAAQPADDSHPYLHRKCARAHGLRIEGKSLLVPMRDAVGTLHSLQTIDAGGAKRFLAGGRVKGCYHSIGRPSGKVLICEGYVTGATLFEETGHAVAVAFNAGNLQSVALALRAKYPCLTLVLCADDDWTTDGNPGLTAAQAAAMAVGGLLSAPDFSGLPRGDKDTDWNDWARLRREAGIEGVTKS